MDNQRNFVSLILGYVIYLIEHVLIERKSSYKFVWCVSEVLENLFQVLEQEHVIFKSILFDFCMHVFDVVNDPKRVLNMFL